MDPIKINITVTLDASDKLLGAIQSLTGGSANAPTAPETKPAPRQVETKPEPRKVETKEDPAPVQEPEPEKPAEITDEALRALIKEVRTATSPAAVRGLFNEFGIKTSIECPQERRAELVDRLKKLAA
jgi:hypothetical protein